MCLQLMLTEVTLKWESVFMKTLYDGNFNNKNVYEDEIFSRQNIYYNSSQGNPNITNSHRGYMHFNKRSTNGL